MVCFILHTRFNDELVNILRAFVLFNSNMRVLHSHSSLLHRPRTCTNAILVLLFEKFASLSTQLNYLESFKHNHNMLYQ